AVMGVLLGLIAAGLFARSKLVKWVWVVLSGLAGFGYALGAALVLVGKASPAFLPVLMVVLATLPPIGWVMLLGRSTAGRVVGGCALVVAGEAAKLALALVVVR
ncbi:MAG TPA: hypothetical protein VF796_21710, partial [Humisphaera sp.]